MEFMVALRLSRFLRKPDRLNYYKLDTHVEVLVTGAAGFIGRNLVRALRDKGCGVRALVLPGDSAAWGDDPQVRVVEGDVRDGAAVCSAAEGVAQIYHLAALTAPDPLDPGALREINVDGTAHVARAAIEHQVDRLVFTSSVAVHGRRIRRHGIDEQSALHPDSPYAESKVAAESLLNVLHASAALPVVIARTSNVFGPGVLDWLEFFRVIADGRFRFIGSGNGMMQFTSVADFCGGLWLCGNRQGIEGRTYILTGGDPISLREWIALICEEVGGTIRTPSIPAAALQVYNLLNSVTFALTGRELPRADRLNLFLGDRSFDITRARNELGYSPQTTAKALVRSTAEWYRSRGWLD
jgi:dihydroflavonol-4-reductase